MSLVVSEIFYSIQGESLYAGLPCTFVRLAGCNLRCTYCDTQYARTDGHPMDLSTVLTVVGQTACPLVEITGGEPLLQDETPELAGRLLDSGYQVLVETNGSLDIDRVDRRCSRIMDVKCPSSGQSDHMDKTNFERLTQRDQVKFVIGGRQDYVFAKDFLPAFCRKLPAGNILFSPMWDRLPLADLAEWILADRLQVRLHFQLHKLLWPDKERGV